MVCPFVGGDPPGEGGSPPTGPLSPPAPPFPNPPPSPTSRPPPPPLRPPPPPPRAPPGPPNPGPDPFTPPLLAPLHDQAVAGLALARLRPQSGLAPRTHRSRHAYRGAPLAAAPPQRPATPGVQLDVVHDGPRRDIAQRQGVARLDLRRRPRGDLLADAQPLGSQDVPLLPVRVVQQGDAGGAGRGGPHRRAPRG